MKKHLGWFYGRNGIVCSKRPFLTFKSYLGSEFHASRRYFSTFRPSDMILETD